MTKKTEYAPFPAADYIRDIRAAGGVIELIGDRCCIIDGSSGFKAQWPYIERMNADPDHRARIFADLEAEAQNEPTEA